jgi:adenine-specific DNA methylase
MREAAKRLKLKVQWGARRAVLYEVGVLGSTVGKTLCNPPDCDEFRREGERILRECERDLGWMYEAKDPDGNTGAIRYLIWSELVECPKCGKSATLWEGCVRRQPARINSNFRCPHCVRTTSTDKAERVLKTAFDSVLKERVTGRARQPVWLYGATGKRDWSRPVDTSDLLLLKRIAETTTPAFVPCVKIPWGDLYRSGYHQGITHLHHLYTRRNLVVFATMWERAETSPLRDALRFWLLSYNASHATIMTRVVAKQKQRDLVVTSCQPGVLYVSGLPVEKNLFAGLRRKLRTIGAAFAITSRGESQVEVHRGSCVKTGLPANSIDYVFTDPPFGGNIPYGEVNFVNEAWLGECTDISREITISRAQGKKSSDYEASMGQAFKELHRILRNDAKATVVFHSSSAGVWNALHRAYKNAGLHVAAASVLDKTQASFKQVTTAGAVKGDPVLLLTKGSLKGEFSANPIEPVLDELLRRARASDDRAERSAHRLYSRFVTHYLSQAQNVPLDARQFYKLIVARLQRHDVRATAD